MVVCKKKKIKVYPGAKFLMMLVITGYVLILIKFDPNMRGPSVNLADKFTSSHENLNCVLRFI